ncbi:hypothetical protein Ctob_002520 [Chrysochromulina tobinii]|uniref:Uncharacterized protein n=1 Tax=Chrysochromulina tobinii TaxID=1460289 RepID=A0A0M0JBF7_9EUKA|nr:hypothetical protein Ctob_002520 [Chrysochromulina tobinii]|eukprot:KOO23543.1 hypothetical protein Ctob_002520 [Chrysochromulina sp. CCMP291]
MVEAEAAAAAAPAAMGGDGKKRMRLAPRGTALVVVPTTSYGAGTDYFWEDVVAVARLLQSKKITSTDLRKKTADGTLLHRVPYSTMMGWIKDDDEVMPEGVLAVEMGRAAAKNQPYAEEEVTQLLLDTAKAACRIAWLDAGVRTTL